MTATVPALAAGPCRPGTLRGAACPPMPRRKPLDPLSPLEREKDPEQLRKLPKQALFLYAFSADSPPVRNRERRKVQGIQVESPEGGSDA